MKTMASSPITPCQTGGENVETVSYFIFLGSKLNAEGDCSRGIKDACSLEAKELPWQTWTLYWKSRDISLPAKISIVRTIIFFLVVMCGCENWTRKKAECRRIDTFELWCWRRLLRVLWTARKSPNQSILKDVSPEYSLEDLVLKLKLQYFGHLIWRAD